MNSLSFEAYLTALQELKNSGVDFMSITLVRTVGSAPQDLGARALVTSQGLQFGTVGGGKVEHRAIEYAKELLNRKVAKTFVDWNLQKDIGMTCGGVVTLYFELFESQHPFSIQIFGAGHVGQELARLLLHLDCEVQIFDTRSEWLDKLPKNPRLKIVHSKNLETEVDDLPDNSYLCIMTMGHATDLPVVTAAMKQHQRFKYIGNMGSDQKALRLRHDLKEAGISEEVTKKLTCPIGEAFGTNSPAEISFSIVAQILKIRDSH